MRMRLYIGKRRYRHEWITIDDIFLLEGGQENLVSVSGAKALLDSTRQLVNWKLSQVDKVFHGNVWEGEVDPVWLVDDLRQKIEIVC